jgi:hypothetical protein
MKDLFEKFKDNRGPLGQYSALQTGILHSLIWKEKSAAV